MPNLLKLFLVAAHCLSIPSLGAVKFVKIGMISRSETNEGPIYNVSEIFKHPDYNTKTYNNDIGLLRLSSNVPLSEFAIPVCLPTKLHENDSAIASGFGRTGRLTLSSDILQKVSLERFTYSECQQVIKNVTHDTMLCYGHHTEQKDSCKVSNKIIK